MCKQADMIRILEEGMVLAMGCTEPGAIALAAAYAAQQLLPEQWHTMTVCASGNIIKNAYSAGIPGTNLVGIEYAAALGGLVAQPEKGLQVINAIQKEKISLAEELVKQKSVTLELARVPEKLYIEVSVFGENTTAKAVIANMHTNLVFLEKNGEVLTDRRHEKGSANGNFSDEEINEMLSVENIYEFITTVDTQKLQIIQKSIDVNTAISEEGLKNPYGLSIGMTIQQDVKKGYRSEDLVTYAMLLATAGADARMAGADFSVVSNSGSGNQGITCTMPVVAVATKLGVKHEEMLRAVALSNLMSIYIKSQFGRLSGFCGATVAAIGAACGVTYLLGGGVKQVECAVINMIGDVTGMLCDGAKADCALKISTCINAAMQAALMAVKDIKVSCIDGIVEGDVEKTICNFARLGNEGSVELDQLILEMMLKKEKK